MEVRVLGPLQVVEAELEVEVSGPRDRVLLSALALTSGASVRADRLVDALWGERPPRSAAKQLQNLVLRLRKLLGPEAIRTVPDGYMLGPGVAVDAARFVAMLGDARSSDGNGDPAIRGELLARALALWRGDPFAAVAAWEPAAAEIVRLEELRHAAQEDEVDARLDAGAGAECIADVEALVAAAPLREHRWVQLMVALYRSGRQADALRAYQRARARLAEDLGIEPGAELRDTERRVLAQDPSLFFSAPGSTDEAPEPEGVDAAPVECPYQGLLAFQVDDHDRFFGRDALVADLIARLAAKRCLALVGGSGSGKSSLVRAGLVASLTGERVVLLTPGPHPMNELSEQLSAACNADPVALEAALVTDPRTALGRLTGHDRRLLTIVVDQLEEVFTTGVVDTERRAFFDVLVAARDHVRVGVVVALRADFYGRCAEHPDLAAMVSAASVLLAPMRRGDLTAAIERPARSVGLAIEPGFTALVLDDVAREPGALPLVSHALRETWRRRQRGTLTIAGYRSAGGIRGAIARTADEIYDGLPTPQQTVVRDLFLRLTEPGEGTEDTRRKVTFTELVPDDGDPRRREVLELLADARLVTIDDGGAEVAHEALIREWPRLRAWLDEDRDELRLLRELRRAAEEWLALDRDPGALYRGARLVAAVEWRRAARATELTALEREFLDASAAQDRAERVADRERLAEETRANRRLRRMLAAIAVALVVALVAGALALVQRGRAADEATRAETATRRARIGRLVADSRSLRQTDRPLSALLAVTANRLDDDVETRGALQEVLLAEPRLRATRQGTTDRYSQVAYSADGRRLAVHGAAGADVFEARGTGAPTTLRLPSRASRATGLAFGPDGRTIAVGGDDATSVFDSVTARRLGTPLPATAPVLGIAFSPDGTVLATAAGTFGDASSGPTARSVELWDAATHERLGVPVTGHEASVNAVAFSPDGQMLATGGNDDVVVLHDPRAGTALGPPIDVGSDVYSVAFSPDGAHLAVGALAGTRVFNVPSGEPQGAPLAAGALASVAFSPDGSRLVTSTGNDSTIEWDAATLQVVGAPMTPGGAGVAYRPGGHELAVSGADSTVSVWDPTAAPLFTRPVPDGSRFGGEFSPDGAVLAVPDANSATLHDAADLAPLGAPFVVAGGPSLPIGAIPAIVEFSPAGDQLAVAGLGATVQLFDVEGRAPIGDPVSLPSPAIALTFSPDGRTLAVGGYRGDLSLIDVRSAQRRAMPDFAYTVLSLTFSPDARRLLVATAGIEAVVVDRLSQAVPRVTPVGGDGFVSARFSPDGSLVATGDADGTLRFRDGQTLRTRGPAIPVDRSLVIGIAFAPNGRTLAVADILSNVRLVDVLTRQPLGGVLTGSGVSVPSFDRDGQALALSDARGAAVWSLDVDVWRTDACRIAGRSMTAAEQREYLGDDLRVRVCAGVD